MKKMILAAALLGCTSIGFAQTIKTDTAGSRIPNSNTIPTPVTAPGQTTTTPTPTSPGTMPATPSTPTAPVNTTVTPTQTTTPGTTPVTPSQPITPSTTVSPSGNRR